MRLVVAAVGRLKRGPERELAERYRDRTAKSGRSVGLSGPDILEIAESRADGAAQRIRAEGAALAQAAPKDAVLVALDGGGRPLSSAALAGRLGDWRDSGRPAVIFTIGGADGLASEITSRAALVVAFGAATWPHQLVRIMLLEQLYRATTILSGHPYHRA